MTVEDSHEGQISGPGPSGEMAIDDGRRIAVAKDQLWILWCGVIWAAAFIGVMLMIVLVAAAH